MDKRGDQEGVAAFQKYLFLNTKIIQRPLLVPDSSIADQLDSKRVLLLTENSLNQEETSLLHSMMSACKVSEGDYQIRAASHFAGLDNDVIREVLLLGVEEKDIGLRIRLPFQFPIRFAEKVWIKTVATSALLQNREFKNSLWNDALKPYFLPRKQKA